MAMMISKFHKIIQSKVVWGAFAVLISVAFVSIYTPGSKDRSNARAEQKAGQLAGRLFGEDVSRQEFGQAYQNEYVMNTMMLGRPITINDAIDGLLRQAAWQRLATLKKAGKMGLTATKEQTVAMIQRQPLFQNRQTGGFDRSAYDAFISGYLPRLQMSAFGFESMMAENVVIEKASSMAAHGALVTEEEIKKTFHLFSDKLTVDYATIPRSVAATPAITDEEAKTYFEKNQNQFRMPEKAIVRYVQFAVADYTNSVAVTDEMVSNFYNNYKDRFVKEGAEDSLPEYQPIEEVKDAIVADIAIALARRAAANAADELVARLSDESITFDKAAETAGVAIVSSTPAFSLTDQVKGVDPTAPFARVAFALEKEPTKYYSDPVTGRDYVYVIALEKKLPSFLPAFDLVKEDVVESATLAAAEKAYVEKAESIHADIETALKTGMSFADAAAKFKFELKTTAPFDVSTPPEGEFGQQLMQSTVLFDAGTLVDLIPTTEEFVIACVASKEPADETTLLPAMRPMLEASIRNDKARRLAAAWQQSVLEEAGLVDLLNAAANDES